MISIGILIALWAVCSIFIANPHSQFSLAISQNIKGVCCVGIVFLHTIKSISGQLPLLYHELEFWGPAIVGVFFALSGYGLAKNYMARGGGIFCHGISD